MGDLYPNLGFDPCPGDLAGYEALAGYAGRSAATLTDAAKTLAAAGSDQWRGHAADAFRGHVHTDLLPLVGKAANSIGQAATALREWALTLASLQDEARALDRQAAPYQVQLTAALRSAGLPATAQPPYQATLRPAHQARIDEANTALSGITARASDLHAQYLAVVQRTGSQLEDAGNMSLSRQGNSRSCGTVRRATGTPSCVRLATSSTTKHSGSSSPGWPTSSPRWPGCWRCSRHSA